MCVFPVIEDDDGVSKGYGFVRFMDEAERNRCYAELDRALGLGKKPITIRPAFAPKSRLACLPSLVHPKLLCPKIKVSLSIYLASYVPNSLSVVKK